MLSYRQNSHSSTSTPRISINFFKYPKWYIYCKSPFQCWNIFLLFSLRMGELIYNLNKSRKTSYKWINIKNWLYVCIYHYFWIKSWNLKERKRPQGAYSDLKSSQNNDQLKLTVLKQRYSWSKITKLLWH